MLSAAAELGADVAVVGAGPAGAAAAIHLARAGRDVVLVDRARFPRDKCCGDGLTTSALRELEALGLEPRSVASWRPVTAAHLRSPSGRMVTLPLGSGSGTYAAVARRTDLDARLVDLAVAAGARLLQGRAVTGASADDDGATLTLAPPTGEAPLERQAHGRQAHEPQAHEGAVLLRAPHVVAADGMWSTVRRELGGPAPGYLGEWHAFRQYFTGVSEQAASELTVWFETDLLPGYAWSFPLPGGVANVGFGILRGGSIPTRAMKDLWPDILARPHIAAFLGPRALPESAHRAWPIPARVGKVPLSAAGGRVLFVGDAAAAADPMTGEGIGQALHTGRWAAEAILAAGTGPPSSAGRAYRRRVRAELVPDALLARGLGRVLRRPAGARLAVRAAGTGSWTRAQFGRWLFEDYPRAQAVTPWRWRRGEGSAGAWATWG